MESANGPAVPTPRKPTLDDVARCADVSHQTVSRVVNGHPSVAAGTRARVLAAIDELGYRPNRAARSLATRRSNTIGIVSFSAKYFGPAQLLVNIEAASRLRGYSLTFTTVDGNSVPEMSRAITEITSLDLDGIIMITPIDDLDLAAVSALCGDTPFVMVKGNPGERVHSVAIDQAHGANLASQHLIALGHQRIGEISGPLTWNDARLRHEGWLASVRAAGIVPGPSINSDWTAAGGFSAARALLAMGTRLSALFVGNDQMALGAMRALGDAGFRVPADVSVVGFDDVPEAAYFDPPLTTVRQDFRAIGQQSVDYLTTLIKAPHTPPHLRILYPHLVVRASTAPPPGVEPP